MISTHTLTDEAGNTTYFCDTSLLIPTDKHDDPDWLTEWLPFIKHEGKPVTIGAFQRAAIAMQQKGYEVFPPDGCSNINDRGYCGGHASRAETNAGREAS